LKARGEKTEKKKSRGKENLGEIAREELSGHSIDRSRKNMWGLRWKRENKEDDRF